MSSETLTLLPTIENHCSVLQFEWVSSGRPGAGLAINYCLYGEKPHVARKGFRLGISSLSLSIQRVMVNVSNFFSLLSLYSVYLEQNHPGFGHAVDHSVHGVESRFSCYPLLQHDLLHIFEFRSYNKIIPSRKDIVPNF